MIDISPTLAITCSLVTASILSLSFASTRKIGILSVTALCYLWPLPVLSLVVVGLLIYFYRRMPQ